MYISIAALIGLLVTMMGAFNSKLSLDVGQLNSLLVFHLCGFSCIELNRFAVVPRIPPGNVS